MRYLPLLIIMCWAAPALAFDLSTQSLVASGYVTSKVTTGPFEHKLMLAAQDDAAAFVATQGQLRGARLDSALNYLRHVHPTLVASDLELAQAILVQQPILTSGVL